MKRSVQPGSKEDIFQFRLFYLDMGVKALPADQHSNDLLNLFFFWGGGVELSCRPIGSASGQNLILEQYTVKSQYKLPSFSCLHLWLTNVR